MVGETGTTGDGAGLDFIGRANGEQATKPSEVGETAAASGPAD